MVRFARFYVGDVAHDDDGAAAVGGFPGSGAGGVGPFERV